MSLSRVLLAALAGRAVHATAAGPCTNHTLDFILLEGDPLMAQIEDDIVADLARVGVSVRTRFLPKADFNTAMQTGDFNLCFTESWGPPYDPHSYATGWFMPRQEAHYAAMDGLEPPMTKAQLSQLVTNVLSEESEVERQSKWTEILQEMHAQAISNPMWSRRVPAVWHRRLQGYRSGQQQFDYPMHTLSADSGSTTITVAPAAQTGLFVSAGRLDPHSYRPNEFFLSNWIYEGLVQYGENGAILPALATSWTASDTAGGGQKYRFTLRTGVTFHDGAAFDCAAVKLNFDHVLQPPLASGDYHGWYHLPLHTTGWACDGEVFEVTLDAPYYPFLQELSLVRPLRMLSPDAFVNGSTTDPVAYNSCPVPWDPVNVSGVPPVVRCAGILGPIGTGPWVYNGSTLRGDGSLAEVRFNRNLAWWGQRGNVEAMRVVNYPDSSAIKQALLDGSLDVAVGPVLTPRQLHEFQTEHAATHSTVLGPNLFNQVVVLNANRTPTDDIQVRKLIMHSVDKAAIVDKEMFGQASVADSLFPRDFPYCDVDLTPRWDYDFEKATLMNCPAVTGGPAGGATDTGLILGLCLGIGLPALAAVGAISFCMGKRSGYDQFKGEESQKKRQQDQPAPYVVGATDKPGEQQSV